jgi:hypothetical protein
MTHHDIAAVLLLMMPVATAVKTLSFLIISLIMLRQASKTPLGHWILGLFLATTCMSFIFTDLTYYLYTVAEPENINTTQEWFLLTGVSTLPFAVSICAVMVAVWNRRLDNGTEPKDARDDRQDEREGGLDVRADEQDARGKQQDKRGWDQSRRGLRMDDRNVAMDTQATEQDARDVRQDAREAEQNGDS